MTLAAEVNGAFQTSNNTVYRCGTSVSDFLRDGHPDVIWEAPSVGWAQVWYLGGPQGATLTAAANLTQSNPWQMWGLRHMG